MSRPDRKFARFYFDDFIREFPAIYADDAAFAAWMRLLVRAEKDWPTTPELPRSIRSRPLAVLVRAELVELCDEHCYRIRGFDAERRKREQSARNAAAVRWQSASNADADANAYAEAMLSTKTNTKTNTKDIPPPPAERGRRKEGTNPRSRGSAPRQVGESPRQNGTAPRQEREREKRSGMPASIHDILRRAAAEGNS